MKAKYFTLSEGMYVRGLIDYMQGWLNYDSRKDKRSKKNLRLNLLMVIWLSLKAVNQCAFIVGDALF